MDVALRYTHVPLKQAVISPSALSLMYPEDEIPGYSREEFIDDLLREHEAEVRACLRKGARKVQIDFTEGRLAVKIDSSGDLLHSFIDLNNMALSRFSSEDRKRIGVHTCPGGDLDSTHSADVDYAELLPSLFERTIGSSCTALAGEKDRTRILKIIRKHMKPGQRVFVGVVAPIDPRVETPEEVRDRVLEAAEYILIAQLGTTDDCGFAPFCDDTRQLETSPSRRSARASKAPRSQRKHSCPTDGCARGQRGGTASLRCFPECPEHSPCAQARRGSSAQAVGVAAGHAREHRRRRHQHAVRRKGIMVPAVALTAFARSEDRTRALQSGYQTHIAKPMETAELLATVASLAQLKPAKRKDR